MGEAPCPLARRFATLAREAPGAPALLGGGGNVLASRADLAATAQRLSQAWSSWLEPGHCVGLSLPNSPDLVASFLALRMCGARVALIDSTAPPKEVEQSAATVGARHVCTTPQRAASAKILSRTGRVALLQLAPGPATVAPPGTVVYKLTSGSTGSPRAIAVSARQLVADTVQILRTMGVASSHVTLAAIPLTHSYGLGSCLIPLLLAGTPLVFPSSNLPAALAGALAAARVAHFPAVPAMVRALAAWGDLPPLPDLQVCLSAGAPLASADAAAFHRRTGHKVHVFYGSSECGGITYDRGTAPSHLEGAVGEALERVTVEVVGENGDVLPAGCVGRVQVRSPAVALAMLPAEHGDITLTPGRFLTGDLGELDPGGRLTLKGRVAHLLNVAGRKVHPDEVKRVLEGVPGVHSAVVVGLPDPHRGELVAAVVATPPDCGLTVHDLILACRASLAPHKVPRRIVLVEELPVSERGKLRRQAVLDMLRRDEA